MAADIGKRGSCHLFRHTMATLMLENGADIRYHPSHAGARQVGDHANLHPGVDPQVEGNPHGHPSGANGAVVLTRTRAILV